MKFEKMSTSPKDYVVLDVETSGLTIAWDLLSISIYKPDDNKKYNRFLPLELKDYIPYEAKMVNGINEKQLKGLAPLSQDEVSALIKDYQLDKRIILHYGNIDEKFMRNYFKRHNLIGFDKMTFFNFKKLICSNVFPKATISKDNLCKVFEIPGVTKTHSGINDCILEWKLFKKINGIPIFAKNEFMRVNLYWLSPQYYFPASYIDFYPNIIKILGLPKIQCEAKEVFSYSVPKEEISTVPSNITGIITENLVNAKINVVKNDNREFNLNNFKHLKPIGILSNEKIEFPEGQSPFIFTDDTSINIPEGRHELYEEMLNKSVKNISSIIKPVIDYIKSNIFTSTEIYLKEQAINENYGVMATCNLSNVDSVLKIKPYSFNLDSIKYQLLFEANGRKIYVVSVVTEYNNDESNGIKFTIYEINITETKSVSKKEKVEKTIQTTQENLQNRIGQNISIKKYINSKLPITLKCNTCGYIWKTTYNTIKFSRRVHCKNCASMNLHNLDKKPNTETSRDNNKSDLLIRAQKYAYKIEEKSNGNISININDYKGSKQTINAKCNICGSIWHIRADHLLQRCWCPMCKKNFQKNIHNR